MAHKQASVTHSPATALAAGQASPASASASAFQGLDGEPLRRALGQ